MPRDLKRHAYCAGPDVARPHTLLGGLTGFLITLYYAIPGWTVVTVGALVVALFAAFGPAALCGMVPVLIWAAHEVDHWYYRERLLCVRDEGECAIGTVIAEPTRSRDGDRKLNLLLAPFTRPDIEVSLVGHIDRNRAMLSDPANFPPGLTPPLVPTLNELTNDPTKLRNYIVDLRPAENMWNQVCIGVMDTLMLPSSARNFFNRFYRKDDAHITDPATWEFIPVDLAAPDPPASTWQDPNAQNTQLFPNHVDGGGSQKLNPMFRWDDDSQLPYLHTEIDGNWVEVLLQGLMVALLGIGIGCLIPPLGPVGGAILGTILLLLFNLFNRLIGNDGYADDPDVDWDDPDYGGPGGFTGRRGDVVAVYGPWIMDTEHGQYFEIHPVQAYYILALNQAGEPEPVEENTGPPFNPGQLTEQDVVAICEQIRPAEIEESAETIEREGVTLLSYGMTTRYGGGGANVPIE